MSQFREAYLRARRRVEDGEDPELVVPEVLALAEAQEEIAMVEALYEPAAAGEPDEELA
ncbi:MAG: hypothetical protein QOJ13_341 [Gaiellales bacterium]|jgi:hypothetical protein|nr:hypothetical protein [Gaiellales bacterium]MDX6591145.1 hypothetical protein [Gaiellales bacterium]